MHPITTDPPMEDQPSPPKHTCTGELELKAVTPNGTVIWKIPDITRQRSEAIEGKTQSVPIHSILHGECGLMVIRTRHSMNTSFLAPGAITMTVE